MKKTHLVFALALLIVGFAACKKSESTPAATTTTTTGTTVVPEYNSFVIDNVLYPVQSYSIAQANNDYSYYALFSDSTLKTTELRCLFNPQPTDTAIKSYTIIPGAPVGGSQNTQLTLTYDQQTAYNAVSGGTVNVTVLGDSTWLKFDGVKFSKGSATKTMSGWIAVAN